MLWALDDDCELALTSSPAVILIGVENYFDANTGAFLHLKDELLDWLSKTGKMLGLHVPMMLDFERWTLLRLPHAAPCSGTPPRAVALMLVP
jgi:hypothetical protein